MPNRILKSYVQNKHSLNQSMVDWRHSTSNTGLPNLADYAMPFHSIGDGFCYNSFTQRTLGIRLARVMQNIVLGGSDARQSYYDMLLNEMWRSTIDAPELSTAHRSYTATPSR